MGGNKIPGGQIDISPRTHAIIKKKTISGHTPTSQ